MWHRDGLVLDLGLDGQSDIHVGKDEETTTTMSECLDAPVLVDGPGETAHHVGAERERLA